MDNYKPNSYRSKEEKKETPEREKKIEKVVTGAVRTKKKNGIQKLVDIFVPEDIVDVKNYILMEILIPAIKDGIEDVVHMVLRGESTGRKKSPVSRVSYGRYYDRERDRRSDRQRDSDEFDYDDLIFETRGDAEAVLLEMKRAIKDYDIVSVFDMYDFAGLSAPFTLNRYGWADLTTARVARASGGGYVIKLPKALPLD